MSEQSRYCYKGTDVLINKFNITDQESLDKAESDITHLKVMQLESNPVKGNFDLLHLQKIHRHIFGDIYNFAGQLREENIAKGNFPFASAMYLKPNAEDLFKQLRKENFLVGKPIGEFSDRAAYFMSEINVLHPFREGNGRTQREFIRTLAAKCGYKLNWDKVPKDVLFNASVKSIVDIKDLSKCIESAIENPTPIKEVMKVFEKTIPQMER